MSANCLTCRFASFGNRTDIPEGERKHWGDCTWKGLIPAVYSERYIQRANPETDCPAYEEATP
jgi:hypothetical protein